MDTATANKYGWYQSKTSNNLWVHKNGDQIERHNDARWYYIALNRKPVKKGYSLADAILAVAKDKKVQ